MMLQLTKLPIVAADAMPGVNAIIDSNLSVLESLANFAFAPRIKTIKAEGRTEIETGFNLQGALSVLNAMLNQERNLPK